MTNTDAKTCPMCAETVKAAAVRCRFCGYDFAGLSLPGEVASEPKPKLHSMIDAWVDGRSSPQHERQGLGCFPAVMICLGALVLAFYAVWPTDDEFAANENMAHAAASLDAETTEKCRGLLQQGEQSKVIRKVDQSAKRLYVDDRLWAELGPDARKGVAGAAVCYWFGLKIADSTFDQSVMVVSWQSGKQLSLVANGYYIDNMD